MAFSVSSPVCFLLLLLFLPNSTTAQTYKNISLGSSLTAQNNKNSSWLSPSGEFAFGFQKVSPGAFLLAIWFDKIPEKTIVWSANGDELAPSGSEVKLTTAGQFVLNDPKGQQIWNASSAATGVAYAAMLDTGNLVLADKESVNLWDSFDEPTDTILPTQILKQGTKLVARFSEMNYSRGRFEFSMQTDGNLVLYLKDYPTESADYDYWSTNTVGSGFQVIFNQSGDISLVAKNGGILNQISSYETSTRGFYQRAILGSNGVLRQYVYPKNGSSSTGRWPVAWSASSTFKPDNICTSIAADVGTGVCGLNSYCTLGDDQRTNCNCPPGYVSMDPKDKLSGCKQDFVPQSCEEASQNVNSFDLKAIPNTDWHLSDYDARFQDINEDWCREACLSDCSCAAAIFRGSKCWTKRIPLSNGRQSPDVGGKAFIKVRKDNSTTAQTYKNISLGSSLIAKNNENSSWLSPSGEFAFGFQKVSPRGFLLAIWFDKIPEKTIVWSANGNQLAPSGSAVQLTTDGQFVLNDPKGQQIWNASFAGTGVAHAAMLDTGNLVLADNEFFNLWRSFDEPTDTILPTQILKQGTKLAARFSETNYSRGRFEFLMQTDGNLVFYLLGYPTETVNDEYWSADTVGSGFQVIFNQSGDISLVAKNGSILNQISSYETLTRVFYQRAILDYDGVFRQYAYPKNGSLSTGRWPVAWSASPTFKPENICTGKGSDVGGGACGFNSYCTLVGDDGRTKCDCPPGYVLLDPNDKLSGCRQNFVPQSCVKASQEVNFFELRAMPNTDWNGSNYMYFQDVNEDWCREACLSDCFCAAAIFRGSECWKKKNPLTNGRQGPDVGMKALIKVMKDNSPLNSTGGGPKEKDRSTLIIIVSVLLGSSVFFNIILLLPTLLMIFHMNRRKPKMIQDSPIMPSLNLRSFSFEELKEATDEFKEELGRGAFATVYKGVITLENRNLVAVKKLDSTVREGEQEFKAELSAIGRTNHKNLVRLLGFCNEGQHRLLVFEFMSNGSLASFLFGDSRPNWYKRIQIAFGTARGLIYLHEECSTQIIHCDIKPQNILLDDSLVARISDFGLAKLLRTDHSRTFTDLRGTKGYVAPEWFTNMPITVKVDVFSFGILLLELICCRKNFEADVEDESLMILANWTYDCYRDGKLDKLVENDEEAMGDMKRVEKFVTIALWCIQEEPSLRPSMKKVTQMLEGVVEVPVLPDPLSFISSVC